MDLTKSLKNMVLRCTTLWSLTLVLMLPATAQTPTTLTDQPGRYPRLDRNERVWPMDLGSEIKYRSFENFAVPTAADIGVINDGGRPGQHSGDGAFLLSQE